MLDGHFVVPFYVAKLRIHILNRFVKEFCTFDHRHMQSPVIVPNSFQRAIKCVILEMYLAILKAVGYSQLKIYKVV